MNNNAALRSQLVHLLEGGNAHITFDQAIEGLNLQDVGKPVEGLPHTIWQLVDHIRIAQHDIIDFSQNPHYHPLTFPDGYWPSSSKPRSSQEWEQAIEAIDRDHQAMIAIIEDEQKDLLEPIPHGDGQTLLREAMLIVDHTGYHVAQIVQIRRILGCW